MQNGWRKCGEGGESDLAKSLTLLAKVKSEGGESTPAKPLKSLMSKAKKSPLYKYNPGDFRRRGYFLGLAVT